MSRILRLRTLIEHPGTGAGERAAAQRMLDRILSKTPRIAGEERTYGARYSRVGRHADLSEIADSIVADIAFARVAFTEPGGPEELAVLDPIWDAPAEVEYQVSALTDEASIVITVEGVPRQWGWQGEDGPETVSPALRALAQELAEIMNSYNHDGENIGKRFFARVRVPQETLVW